VILISQTTLITKLHQSFHASPGKIY